MDAIRARNLTFRYKGRDGPPALDGCSFTVRAGEVYGLLGPNGAGKTTLLRLLGTLLVPTSGTLEVLGEPIPEGEERARAGLGVAVGEYERTFHFRLSGAENLRYFAAFHPSIPKRAIRDRVAEVLRLAGLAEAARIPYGEYSQGMKHRLALARALLPRPRLLLLDEPTSGVDAPTARAFLQVVRELAGSGIAVVYATHHLEEAGDLCNRVLVLKEGRRIAEASPDDLRRLHEGVDVLDLRLDPPASDPLLVELRAVPDVLDVVPTRGGGLRVHHRAGTDAPYVALDLVRKAGHKLRDVRRDAPSLEDAFLRLTGSVPA